MVDEKPKKVSKGIINSTNGIEAIVSLIIAIIIFGYLFERLRRFVSGQSGVGNKISEALTNYYYALIPYFKLASLIISALCLVGIFYYFIKISRLRAEERAYYYPPQKNVADVVKNRKWERIQDHINSQNSNDWKLAILEADIILNEMLDSMGYRGATMGDKLKNIEKSDFTTLDNAWEAHKVRNQIAHEGADFAINEREARRVIGLYESVFKEFNYI